MGAEDLVQVLRRIAPFDHPWVDSRVGPLDDAALVRPEGGPELVLTVDFITPIVDEPEAFGAIAAANALSDVYAMGGEPRVALAVCGFPDSRLPREVLERILRGGRDKAAEAGCAIAGGHTMIDPELKYGLCVLGELDPARRLAHPRARPGDVLFLTKPIGFGIAAQALKRGELERAAIDRLTEILATLNRGAKDAALAAGARAATDVTGFGLLGHLHHLLAGAGCAAELDAAAVPVFAPVPELLRAGHVPGGTRRNLAYVDPHVEWGETEAESERLLLADAQTSGGLVIAVAPEDAETLAAELTRRATPSCARIGELVEGEPGAIALRGRPATDPASLV